MQLRLGVCSGCGEARGREVELTFQLGEKTPNCDQACPEPLMTRARFVLRVPEKGGLPRIWDLS